MFNYNYKKVNNLPIYYDNESSYSKEKEILFNIKDYLQKNEDENVYIYQIVTSPLENKLFNLKEENKLIYFNKDERILISKLDENIFENWIGFFWNDNKPYKQEYLEKIDEFKKKWFSLSEAEEKALDFYREKWLKENNITDLEKIKELTNTRTSIEWERKFEFKDINNENIRFDYRNVLTTFFTVGNYKKWYKIIWIWWWWASWSREIFSKWVEQMFFLLNDKQLRDRFWWTDIFLYDNHNELRKIRSYRKYMLINYDVWSNYPDMDFKIKEKIKQFFPFMEPNCFSYSTMTFPFAMIRELEKSLKKYKKISKEIKDEFVEEEFKELIKFYENWNSLNLKKKIPIYNSPIKIKAPETVKEVLLYIDKTSEDSWEWENKLEFYFWTLKDSTGDDWDDNPAIHNSGVPYQDCIIKVIKVYTNSWNFKYHQNMENFCFDDIKKYKKVIWTFYINNKAIEFKFWDDFNKIFKNISSLNYEISLI